MSELIGKKFDVLDQGYVILRDVMGDDQSIVNAARISYQQGTRKVSEDAGLIDHLMRHRHTSPFEMPVLRFQVKLPIFVERQWVRHRTCSMNEMSGRYSEMPEEFYVPEVDVVRAQSKTNKQGREEPLHIAFVGKFIDRVVNTGEGAFKNYKASLDLDVARELARIQLPLGTYTEKVWQMNLHNLLHFLKLRTDSHAQWEIQQYANVIEGIVAEFFPLTYGSWKNHVKDAVILSHDEMGLIRLLMDDLKPEAVEDLFSVLPISKSRKLELRKKLGL
jgi:thymidylate synthase (FAD)